MSCMTVIENQETSVRLIPLYFAGTFSKMICSHTTTLSFNMKNPFTRTIPVLPACMIVIIGNAVTAPYATAAPKLPPSTAISHFVEFNLINSTNTIIADLSSQNLDGRDHQIRTSSEGRILVSAQVRIDNPGGIAVRGGCHLFISDGTGPANGLTEISVRPAVWFTTDNAAYGITVPVLGYATKRRGTYNVVVECELLAFNGGTTGRLDNMIVWEAAK